MHFAGLSLRGWGRGFSPVTMNVAPGYFHRKTEEEKKEPKEIRSCLIPYLLVVFTQQLEILVIALHSLPSARSRWPDIQFCFFMEQDKVKVNKNAKIEPGQKPEILS